MKVGPLAGLVPAGVIKRLKVTAREDNQKGIQLEGPTAVTLWPGETFAVYDDLGIYQLEAQRQGDCVTLEYTREVEA